MKKVLYYLGMVPMLLFFLFPPVYLILTSLKSYRDAFSLPPKFIFTPTMENYWNIFERSNFFSAFYSSLIVSLTATAITIIIGSVTAYALTCYHYKRKRSLITGIIAARVVPPILTLIPVYYLADNFGLIDHYSILIFIYILYNLPFVIIMLMTFFEEVPKEIREAALVDGCTDFRTFFNVYLPITKGGIAATSILSIILIWNEFLMAFVLSGKATQTLPVVITSFMTFQGTEWGPLTAAGTVIMLPMVIFGILIQKHLIKGMTMGAIK